MKQEAAIMFRSNCSEKLHYKRALCQMDMAYDSQYSSVEHCVNDPGFVGKTVRDGGA
jgi:hypothetical protein